MNLVTVIIPCYNCEKWIERAINSVLTQTYSTIELLLVDNNSTDNTYNILEKYSKQYPNIIQVFAQTKKGASAARNLGLSKAKGEWIQFLDADDELLPEKIQIQMNLAKKEDPDLIVDDYCKVHMRRKTRPKEFIKSEDDPWLGLINSRLGITSSNLWKKECLIRIHGWKEGLDSSQEYEMLFRLLKTNPKIIINHSFNTVIHAQPESISRTGNSKKIFKLISIRYFLRTEIYEYLRINNLLNSNYKKSLNLYLYYHLLLISEFDKSLFLEQCKRYDFYEIGFREKLTVYSDFVRHSSKRKFANSNIIIKGLEWYSYFFRNMYLLKH